MNVKGIPLTLLCFLIRAVVTGATSGIGKAYASEVSFFIQKVLGIFSCSQDF